MSEKQELLLKISKISGEINRHKNSQEQLQQSRPRNAWSPTRGAPYGRRARGRGGWMVQPARRNKTLILNTSATPRGPESPADAEQQPSAVTSSASATPAPNNNSAAAHGWIAKHDRHRQLISPAIYERERLARLLETEKSQRLKAVQQDRQEKAKIQQHFQSQAQPAPGQHAVHVVDVQGIPFRVVNGGSCLLRTQASTQTTPKKAVVGGVAFLRSRNGNLYRSGYVQNQKCVRRTACGKPLQAYISCLFDKKTHGLETDIFRLLSRPSTLANKKSEPCKRFTTTGSCPKGPYCPYAHDPDKVAVCKEYLQTGNCSAGDACDLSHNATPERVPACHHFLRGKCSNEQCRYAHVRVNPAAPVCHAFATLGYCEKGARCNDRHIFECPEYANTGVCTNKKCRLPHVDRAGQLRKIGAAESGSKSAAESTHPTDRNQDPDQGRDKDTTDRLGNTTVGSAVSSGEETDSDDIDSEGLADDSFGFQSEEDTGISGQLDFIKL